jgi:hypothetical protein
LQPVPRAGVAARISPRKGACPDEPIRGSNRGSRIRPDAIHAALPGSRRHPHESPFDAAPAIRQFFPSLPERNHQERLVTIS